MVPEAWSCFCSVDTGCETLPWPRSTPQAGSPTPLTPPPPPPQHDLGSRKGSAWHFRSLLPSTSDKSARYPSWEQPPSVCWESAPHLHAPIHFQSVETSSKEGGMRKGVEEKKKKEEINRRTREIKRTQDSRRRKDLHLREEGWESPEVRVRTPPPCHIKYSYCGGWTLICQRATKRRGKRCAMSWSYFSRTKGFPKPRVGGYRMPDFHYHM